LQEAEDIDFFDEEFYALFGTKKPKNRREILEFFHKKFMEIAK